MEIHGSWGSSLPLAAASSMLLQEAEELMKKLLIAFISHKKEKLEVWYYGCCPIAAAPRHPRWHQNMAVAAGRGPGSERACSCNHEAEIVPKLLGKEAEEQKQEACVLPLYSNIVQTRETTCLTRRKPT